MSKSHLLRFSMICHITRKQCHTLIIPIYYLVLFLVLHAGHWCSSSHRHGWSESSVFFFFFNLFCPIHFLFLSVNLLCIKCLLSFFFFKSSPLFCPHPLLRTHHPPLPVLPLPHYLWLIKPGCHAVFTECLFVDYSPRNHVAQLNYQWLQRLQLLQKHLENALFNQPITAKMSMTPAHKETLLHCPCCPWGASANGGFLSAAGDVLPGQDDRICAQVKSSESTMCNGSHCLFFMILHFSFNTFNDGSQVSFIRLFLPDFLSFPLQFRMQWLLTGLSPWLSRCSVWWIPTKKKFICNCVHTTADICTERVSHKTSFILFVSWWLYVITKRFVGSILQSFPLFYSEDLEAGMKAAVVHSTVLLTLCSVFIVCKHKDTQFWPFFQDTNMTVYSVTVHTKQNINNNQIN